jgi:hypothetical protein
MEQRDIIDTEGQSAECFHCEREQGNWQIRCCLTPRAIRNESVHNQFSPAAPHPPELFPLCWLLGVPPIWSRGLTAMWLRIALPVVTPVLHLVVCWFLGKRIADPLPRPCWRTRASIACSWFRRQRGGRYRFACCSFCDSRRKNGFTPMFGVVVRRKPSRPQPPQSCREPSSRILE